MNSIRFSASDKDQLSFAQLRQTVDDIVKRNDPHLLAFTRIKAISLVTSYFILYSLSLTFVDNRLLYISCYLLMGLLVVPIFLMVVHEAVHDNLFRSRTLNSYILYIFDILGANSFIWKKRHKILHHSFQNIAGWDSDIEQASMMKIYPHDIKKDFQKFQHRYMWLLYPLYLVNWLLIRDFKDFFSKDQIVRKVCHIPRREYLKLLLFKAFFVCYMVGLPTLFGQHFAIALLSMLTMIITASVFALLVLLTPHVNINNAFPKPDDTGEVQSSWLKHQFATTNDIQLDNWFARNWLANFNLHLAHHLFPRVSQVHAPEVTKLIISFCRANGFEYRSYSLAMALKYHYDLIKQNAVVEDIFEEDM